MASWACSGLHLGSSLQADGHAETWVDFHPYSKFKQYGWRCTTNEDSYSNRTLMGNWNQERFDLRKLQERTPLPSQFSHYYQSSYAKDYTKSSCYLRPVFQKEPHSFPGHQPELDPPPAKALQASSYMTDYSHLCPGPTTTCRRQRNRTVPAP